MVLGFVIHLQFTTYIQQLHFLRLHMESNYVNRLRTWWTSLIPKVGRRSKHFLISHVDHISTILIRNKLKRFTRLLHSNITQEILLQMLENKIQYPSFIIDITKISNHLGINFHVIFILRKSPRIDAVFDELDESICRDLTECVQFWNIDSMRKTFVDILEANIPCRPASWPHLYKYLYF